MYDKYRPRRGLILILIHPGKVRIQCFLFLVFLPSTVYFPRYVQERYSAHQPKERKVRRHLEGTLSSPPASEQTAARLVRPPHEPWPSLLRRRSRCANHCLAVCPSCASLVHTAAPENVHNACRKTEEPARTQMADQKACVREDFSLRRYISYHWPRREKDSKTKPIARTSASCG